MKSYYQVTLHCSTYSDSADHDEHDNLSDAVELFDDWKIKWAEDDEDRLKIREITLDKIIVDDDGNVEDILELDSEQI